MRIKTVFIYSKSGRRDSNPRMVAWEATALPLGYTRILVLNFTTKRYYCKVYIFDHAVRGVPHLLLIYKLSVGIR